MKIQKQECYVLWELHYYKMEVMIMKIKPLEEQIKDWNNEEIIYGEPIEQREANYFDGYTQGIYRAKNIIDMQQKQISQLTNNWNELEEDINNKIKDIKMNFSQVNGNYFNMNYVIDTYQEVLDKMKEIKEGNNVSSRD